ncbi:helix-turn-helix domain-containing protein [Microbacterium sp. NPDC055665]
MLELLAIRLRLFRAGRRLSQQETAHLIGCSVPTYRLLEQPSPGTGRIADPKLSTIMNVLTTIGVDDQLVKALSADLEEELPTSGGHGASGSENVDDK